MNIYQRAVLVVGTVATNQGRVREAGRHTR